MAEKQFLRLNDKWALAADKLQWILQRRGAFDERCGKYRWRGVSFVATRRDILLRMIRFHNVKPDAAGQQGLVELPATFQDWIAEQKQRSSRFKGAEGATSESTLPKGISASKLPLRP